jgi:hypothetical protein
LEAEFAIETLKRYKFLGTDEKSVQDWFRQEAKHCVLRSIKLALLQVFGIRMRWQGMLYMWETEEVYTGF